MRNREIEGRERESEEIYRETGVEFGWEIGGDSGELGEWGYK